MSTWLKGVFTATLISCLPLLGLCTPLTLNSEAARDEFVAAMERLRLSLPDMPDSPALQSYAIYDYLIAARLRRDLTRAATADLDSKIDAFLRARPGQPVARGLNRDWLVSLAQRRLWDWFLPRSADSGDPVLICYRLEGRLAIGDTAGLAAAALVRWIQPQKQPECGSVFAWLQQQGLLTGALAESRTRAALTADNPRLAREFAAEVPLPFRTPLLQWSDLLESPKAALNVLATHPTLPVESVALAAGFDKLARIDLETALALLPRLLDRESTASTRAHLTRAAALSAAYGHDQRAIALFDDLGEEGVDGQVQEWRVRAALWTGNYSKALTWTEQMPAALSVQPRWRYWHARALAATAGEALAAPLFSEIAALRDYYGYLAADRLHQNYVLNARATPDDAAIQATLAAAGGIIRAHELFDCDLADEATAEWGAALGGTEVAVRVQAALLAARWGWYAQSIATLAQTGEFDDVSLRYPRPFLEAVTAASVLTQVPPDWILAVMRQESLFRKDALSRANARGVMQMLPATAAAVARRWHIPAPGRDGLFDPTLALPLGAAYLRELLDHFNGQLAMSLAAYNGGSAAVLRWLPPKSMDADVWIENIPYNETRGYVQHILEHIVAFAWVRGSESPRLSTLLPAVEPPK